MFDQFVLINLQVLTLYSDIPEALFSSTAPQASSKIVDLPLC